MSKSLINKRLTLMVCIVAGHGTGIAAEEPMEEVRVWGTRVYASSVNLDLEAIATKQSDHISDLLRPIPGVDVGGAHSLNQRITIRSMDDKDLRISIDGANQNTYMYHHMGNLQIHADILKSVEIDVGNNSVVNGGLGGAVRFETKEARDLLGPDRRLGARVQGSYATNASTGYSLTGYGQMSETADFLAYYNAIDRDNYEVGGGEIKDADGNVIPGTDGEVRGLEGELTDGLVKFGWDLTSNQRLELGYEAYVDEGDYSYRPDMGLATDLAIADSLNVPLVYPTEFTRDTVTLNYDVTVGDHTMVKTALFRNDSTLWRDETGLESWFPDYAVIVEGQAENTGFNVLANTVLSGSVNNDLTYGVETINYDTAYRNDGVQLSGEEATNRAVFVEDRIGFGAFALIPGIRYDSYDIDTTVINDTFSDSTGALAAEYQFGSSLLLSLSTTQLFKGPEIGETFTGAGLYDTPNPAIEAETGRNDELALAFERSGVSAGFTLFETEIENYIYDYASNPADGYWKDNVGDMTVDGYEAYAGFDAANLSTLLTFSSAESELSADDAYGALEGARIDRQQGGTISASVDYDIPVIELALHWDVLAVDDVPAAPDLDGATLDNSKEGYTVHNISVRWTPGGSDSGLTATFGVDNLFDEYYASQSSRTGTSFHPVFGQLYLLDYEPGRNIKATLAYTF